MEYFVSGIHLHRESTQSDLLICRTAMCELGVSRLDESQLQKFVDVFFPDWLVKDYQRCIS